MDKIEEEKEQVVETIRNLLPFELPEPTSSGPESSTSTQVYEQLAEFYEESPSTEGHNEFADAIDEIYTAYSMECSESASDIPETADIISLAAIFNELTMGLNSIRKENLTRARDIYGKFLCLQEKAGDSRRKRDTSKCDCPESGVSQPCHFFACLEEPVTKFIMGFGNSLAEQPCIGFIIDTTGSMSAEIAAARRVILQFIKSQADSTWCYLLVPFNDHGSLGHPNSKYLVY